MAEIDDLSHWKKILHLDDSFSRDSRQKLENELKARKPYDANSIYAERSIKLPFTETEMRHFDEISVTGCTESC